MVEYIPFMAIFVASQLIFAIILYKSKKQTDFSPLSEQLNELGQKIVDQTEQNTGPLPVDDERMATLERRMETLESDVLKNLNKITQRERRMREMEGLEEPEPEATPEQIAAAQNALENYVQPGQNGSDQDPMDYVMSHISQRR